LGGIYIPDRGGKENSSSFKSLPYLFYMAFFWVSRGSINESSAHSVGPDCQLSSWSTQLLLLFPLLAACSPLCRQSPGALTSHRFHCGISLFPRHTFPLMNITWCSSPSCSCNRTAPIPVFDASACLGTSGHRSVFVKSRVTSTGPEHRALAREASGEVGNKPPVLARQPHKHAYLLLSEGTGPVSYHLHLLHMGFDTSPPDGIPQVLSLLHFLVLAVSHAPVRPAILQAIQYCRPKMGLQLASVDDNIIQVCHRILTMGTKYPVHQSLEGGGSWVTAGTRPGLRREAGICDMEGA